ncbi:MAG: sodium/proton-translocating pyrophosphatase, partial [bacterium]|nr:sodium/proton-translocating pyrophosphatase [bacterium]
EEITRKQAEALVTISQKIRDGADVFLKQEFLYIFMFMLIFAIIIALACEPRPGVFYTTCAFLIGACTSVLCGFIGMKVATEANYRTTYESSKGLGEGFRIAYYGGCVLGFVLVSISIIILTLTIAIFKGINYYLFSYQNKLVINLKGLFSSL